MLPPYSGSCWWVSCNAAVTRLTQVLDHTKVLAKLLSAGITQLLAVGTTEEWPALSKTHPSRMDYSTRGTIASTIYSCSSRNKLQAHGNFSELHVGSCKQQWWMKVPVVVLDKHRLEASNPDPDALAVTLFEIQDALDPNYDGTIGTEALAELLAAGITE